MKYKNIIIDINNLFFRSYYHAVCKKVLYDGVELYPTLIKKCLNTIKQLKKEYGHDETNVYCLFDNCQSAINIRKIISENNYKSNRDKNNVPQGFYKTLDIFFCLLEYYKDNMYILRLHSNEADDLVDPLLKSIKPKNLEDNALLISADMDWARSISKFVHWYNYGDVYTPKKFENIYNFFPSKGKVVLYKIFDGDSSDHIKPAIPYLKNRSITAAKIANNFENLDDLLIKLNSTEILDDKLKEKINENMLQIRTNEQLVSFMPIKKKIEDIIIECHENIRQLKMIYEILELPLEPRMVNSAIDIFKNNPKRLKLRTY
jgi:hypothetical protein